jgi:hypothetical protein
MRGFIEKSKGIALNGSIYCFTYKAKATPRSSTGSQERDKVMDETEIPFNIASENLYLLGLPWSCYSDQSGIYLNSLSSTRLHSRARGARSASCPKLARHQFGICRS